MLESLVSSRIRRALLEHILSTPKERFYLRGLAKSLNVSVSPLRRELKRLETSGMLKAEEEGNMLFYSVDINSPAFLELARVTLTIPSVIAVPAPAAIATAAPELSEIPVVEATQTATKAPSVARSVWASPLNTPMLVTAAGVGMALVVIVAGIFYLRLTNERIALVYRNPKVTVVMPQASSGVMRGARWQVVPGGFGGFSSGRAEESY